MFSKALAVDMWSGRTLLGGVGANICRTLSFSDTFVEYSMNFSRSQIIGVSFNNNIYARLHSKHKFCGSLNSARLAKNCTFQFDLFVQDASPWKKIVPLSFNYAQWTCNLNHWSVIEQLPELMTSGLLETLLYNWLVHTFIFATLRCRIQIGYIYEQLCD